MQKRIEQDTVSKEGLQENTYSPFCCFYLAYIGYINYIGYISYIKHIVTPIRSE